MTLANRPLRLATLAFALSLVLTAVLLTQFTGGLGTWKDWRDYEPLILALLVLGGCRDDRSAKGSSKASEAARIEHEVERRVGIIERELKLRQARLHTIRVAGFILLSGGAVALLVWCHRSRGLSPFRTPERLLPVARWLDHYPVAGNRIIDPPPPVQNAGPESRRRPPRSQRRNSHKHHPRRPPNHAP